MKIVQGEGVFTVDFNIDFQYAGDFKETVIRMIQENQLKKAVINFSKVMDMESSGIGSLTGVLQNLFSGTSLRSCCIRESILKVLRLANLEDMFSIDSNEKESLNK